MMNEASIEFVRRHRDDDVRTLALQARRSGDVDLPWALDQIQGWQTARRKLPSWAAIDGIIYPPHLSMEQCSSQQTAMYKCGIVERIPMTCRETLIDLTGGFGVDFAFMAKCCHQAVYVERQEHLCKTASHNFELLGLSHARVIHGEAEDFLKNLDNDCTPNVLELRDSLLEAAHHVLIKLSPMLDWHKAVSDLGTSVAEVHLVSVANECKEMLVLLSSDHKGEPTIHCVNDEQSLIYMPSQDTCSPALATDEDASYLYEPNASIMKAGCFGVLTERYAVKALSADSHLFVSSEKVMDFPGRRFAITAITTMNKKELSRALNGITRANIAVRNFPMSAQDLRKRLRLHDGGDCYIFGTTTGDNQHLLYLCQKL